MKKGFTLIELLAVIAILSIIAAIVTLNIPGIFSENKNKLSKIQKDQIKNSVEMYINDYCISPISNDYSCPTGWITSYDENGHLYVKTANITLSELVNKDYFESSISNNCSGNIAIVESEIDLSNISCNFNKK